MSATTIATISPSRTVRELALEIPEATRLFEQLGIDYCCGGLKPLTEACASAGVPVATVVEQLEAAQRKDLSASAETNWQTATLSDLIAHITSTHHAFVKQEIPRLEKLVAKVVAAHGERHPEVARIQQTFTALAEELTSHLMKEEQILFPYLVQAESGQRPQSCFGTVENPIRMMMSEHDNAGVALRDLRTTSHDYAVPEGVCISYKTLYQALEAFEADLHQHIHLENNILFPRAIAMK